MPNPPLPLLAFADAPAVAALTAALARIGQPVLSPAAEFGTGAEAGDGPAAGPVLCLLGSQAMSRARLRARLAALRGRPLLALVTDDAAGWDPDLIDPGCDRGRWPCSTAELAFRVQRLLAAAPTVPDVAIDPALADRLARLHLIGESPAFLRAMQRLHRLVRCDAAVLIEGETGTGKELAARAIHYLGGRAGGPFVPINCGALPDHLVENELFGHVRGAYTDARGSAVGAIGEARGGTLFLDEVEALSTHAQAALLRFLQDHEYRPLGAGRACQSDARVVAASNVDLRALTGQRGFRADLFFRLEVLSLELPPLREREGDIALLARHFIERYRAQYGRGPLTLDRRSLPILLAHPWPGNVRELENLVHRAVLLAEGDSLWLQPGGARPPASSTSAPAITTAVPIDLGLGFAAAKAQAIAAFERRYLTALMQATGGNVTQAAQQAAKERRALGKLLKKYAIPTRSGSWSDPC